MRCTSTAHCMFTMVITRNTSGHLAGDSSKLLGMAPDCGPRMAEVVADENHRVIDGFFVTHAVRDPDLCGNGTTLEVEFLAVEFSANYDNGFWFVWAVAPVVKVELVLLIGVGRLNRGP